MSLRPSERAILAQKLISSITEVDEDIEKEWLHLAEKRYNELKSGAVKPINWKELRASIKKS